MYFCLPEESEPSHEKTWALGFSHKPALEASYRSKPVLNSFDLETRVILNLLSWQQKTKALISLCSKPADLHLCFLPMQNACFLMTRL